VYQQWFYIDILCFRCSSKTRATNPNVVFLGRKPHFELNIVDSKFAKFCQPQAWLGGSMMDSLNFSHYLCSLLNIRKAIFVASALITHNIKSRPSWSLWRNFKDISRGYLPPYRQLVVAHISPNIIHCWMWLYVSKIHKALIM
jgi:hypothetical protein